MAAEPLSEMGMGDMPHLNGTGVYSGIEESPLYLQITDNRVTDHQLTTSLWLNAVLGAFCFMTFCILQRSVTPKHYRQRLESRNVTVPPEPLAKTGWRSLIDWLYKALTVSETDILASVGLDAMVMIKGLSTGLQMFAPLALLGCTVLLPIHYQYKTLEDHDVNRSQLMQLTIAALPRGSNLMWVHFVLIVVYNVWAMFVLYQRTKEFVLVRQHYLVKGDDTNYWLQQTRQQKAEDMFREVQLLLTKARHAAEEAAKQKLLEQKQDQHDPPPPAAGAALSPHSAVQQSSQSTTSMKWAMTKSWQTLSNFNIFASITKKSKGNLLRSSFGSYKPYTDESTPAASPPITSPLGSSLAGAALQQFNPGQGQPGTAAGSSLHSSTDGLELGAEGSKGDSLGAAAAAVSSGGSLAGFTGSVGGVDTSSMAATAGAGSLSGGSSRRWSGSSGGASDGVAGQTSGMELVSADFAGRRQRITNKVAGKNGRMLPIAVQAGGVAPTQQTINELHSMQPTGPPTLHENVWPLMPKHMRTITEDSLEYRLESSTGNTSRPSSRGGLTAGVGHNRASSGGTGDLSSASPSSVSNTLHCRTPTSALSASLAAAGIGDSGARLHRHSHSHSGGSTSSVQAAGTAVSPSPLSRSTSAQPGSLTMRSGSTGGNVSCQEQLGHAASVHASGAADLSTRGSVDSFAPSSVCTRITHNSSSGRSSPSDPEEACSSETDEDCRSRCTYSRSSSPAAGPSSTKGSVQGASPEASAADASSTVSTSSAAARDISFGGGIVMSQQAQGLSPEQVHLMGVDAGVRPIMSATVSGLDCDRQSKGEDGSPVDFSALHLQDLSRADTPLSPEDGGFLSPEPMTRRRRVGGNGRWSPFASCEQIASTIAADGIAGEDLWSGSAQCVQQVQSNSSDAADNAHRLQASNGSKQRFLRPGPGWQPPAANTSVHPMNLDIRGQQRQQQRLRLSASGAAGDSDSQSKSAQLTSSSQAGLAMGQFQGHSEFPSPGQSQWAGSSSAINNAKSQRQRVVGPYNSHSSGGLNSGRNSSEPSPTLQQQYPWVSANWQQHGSRGTASNATSNSSRHISPYASTHVTPRDSRDPVGGAAVGAGQLLSVGAAVSNDATVTNNALFDDEAFLQPPVAYHWWKQLPAESLRKVGSATKLQQEADRPMPCDALGMAAAHLPFDDEQHKGADLAKPSVRYRKTINMYDKWGSPLGVGAQHYAVLITDVDQWPYPEIQEEHEMKRKQKFVYKAWGFVSSVLSKVPQSLAWGLWSDDPPWTYRGPPLIEQQQLLQKKPDELLSDMHHLAAPEPAVALVAGAAAAADGTLVDTSAVSSVKAVAGGTSGGTSAASRASKSQVSRGQLSSCATSSEGIGSAGAGCGNPLSRGSMGSHASHVSHRQDLRPLDADELNAASADGLAVAKQEVLQALVKASQDPEKQSQTAALLARIEGCQERLHRDVEAIERHELSREQSYILNAASRSTSYMRLPAACMSAAAPGGTAPLLTASRASSFQSSRQHQPDAPMALSDRSNRGTVGALVVGPTGVPLSRSNTPASLHASSDAAGSYGADGMATRHHAVSSPTQAANNCQQQQLHGSMRWQRSRLESPRLLEANIGDVPLHMYSSASQAVPAGGAADGQPAGLRMLEQTQSEPLTAAALKERRTLHPHGSQPSGQHIETAATALGSEGTAETAAERAGSTGSHGLLVGEPSMESPMAHDPGRVHRSISEAGAANDNRVPVSPRAQAATAGTGTAVGAIAQRPIDSWMSRPASPLSGGIAVGAVQHHHRRYVYRSTSSLGGSPEPIQQREAEQGCTPIGSGLDSRDRGYWASMPSSPLARQQPASAKYCVAAALTDTPASRTEVAPPHASVLVSAAAVEAPVSERHTDGGAITETGVSDSYDSNASSYAMRRPVVSFKPYPPDSPRALQQQQRQAFGGTSHRELLSSSFRNSAVAGAALGSGQRPHRMSTDVSNHVASRRASYSSQHLNIGSHLGVGVGGSSGGGAPPASSGQYAASAMSRSRSARLSNSQAELSSHHPDHLSILIPPVQQCQFSRSGTPGGSSGGLGGSSGGLGASSGAHHAAMPWGLPPDAAMLTNSMSVLAVGSSSPATSNDMRSRPAWDNKPCRWSTHGTGGGVNAERSYSAGSIKAVAAPNSHVASPHSLDQTGTIPAGGPGFSRAGSLTSSEMPVSTTAGVFGGSYHDTIVDDLQDDAYCVATEADVSDKCKHTRSGAELWDVVRAAFWDDDRLHPKERSKLVSLLEQDSYSVVTKIFKRLFPKDFEKAIPVFNHRKVDKLLTQWEAAHAALQRAEMKKMRTGREPVRFKGRLGSLLCCCAVGGGCSGCDSCKDLVEGCCKDQLVPIIPEISEQIDQLAEQIEFERRATLTREFTPSWFVIFKTQKAAALAASAHIYGEQNVNKFQVLPAPGPEEVNWQHLWMTKHERDLRSLLTWPLLLAVVLFPITLITSAASRLDYVFCPQVDPGQPTPAFVWDWYCSGKENGESVPVFMRAMITGWVPSLLLNLWLVMVLPRLVYLLVQSEGNCFSLSALERRIGAVFFYWDIFNVFLQGTIGSSFFQQVRKIIQSPEQLPNILGAALPDSSNFFMQFIAMRALFLIWLRMCVPHGGVWQNWCHFLWCPSCCCSACNTERDSGLNYGPRTPRYGFEMGHMLLMYLIALAFAIVSPLLLPFSVVWFAFAWVAWRHNLTYVYQRKYESGGLMWIFLFSRIVMCLVVGQLFTFCVLLVRGAYWQAFLIVAFLPALTARYYKYCHARFLRGVETLPLEYAAAAPKLSSYYPFPIGMYIPPPLQDSSWGWYPEWSKIWDGWGMPSYSL